MRVDDVLHTVFECIAIILPYCNNFMLLDLFKKTFHMGIWILVVKKIIYTMYNHLYHSYVHMYNLSSQVSC